jgi:hypothetical protein
MICEWEEMYCPLDGVSLRGRRAQCALARSVARLATRYEVDSFNVLSRCGLTYAEIAGAFNVCSYRGRSLQSKLSSLA